MGFELCGAHEVNGYTKPSEKKKNWWVNGLNKSENCFLSILSISEIKILNVFLPFYFNF